MPVGADIREQRAAVRLKLKLWGMDSAGHAFSQSAMTRDISSVGARLTGIRTPISMGDVVGVQYEDHKCRCRVVWKGIPGSAEDGEIGLECLEPSECPWTAAAKEALEKEAQSDAELTWPKRDRRRSPRYPCSAAVRFLKQGDALPTTARVSDISLGGCYIENMSPLQVASKIDLSIAIGPCEVAAAAVVKTSFPNMGNGVEFINLTAQYRQNLEQAIALLSGEAAPAAIPTLPAQPNISHAPAPAAAPAHSPQSNAGEISLTSRFQALLELLAEKNLLSRDDITKLLK